MSLNKTQIKIFEYTTYLFSFSLFLYFFGKTLDYGRTYDDFALVDRVLKSPGDAKLISSFLYAKFHFYPIYFLSHELDNFISFLFSFNGVEILNSKVAKFTNIFLHVTNSFLIYLFLKKIFKVDQSLKENIFLYLSSLVFLFHPITSQIIFNITTRNESLALFFGILTFIYCINHLEKRRVINYFFISLLFFFSLCSKLMTVFLAGLIPITIFLLNYHRIHIKENFKRNFDIFILLTVTFIVYYYLRNIFTEKNNLDFFNNINDLVYYFLTSLKFYLIGLFYPYEHIYVYATNYNLKLSIIIFLIFLLYSFFSIYIFLKKKDPILLISCIWICASLTLPIMFGMIERGFPLISNLAERYQYSSAVCISIIVMWIFKNHFNSYYLRTLIISSYFLVLTFSIFILNDRSKVYVNNVVFMSQLDENSPKNVHRYAFSINIKNSILLDDIPSYKFNLYQMYQLDTSFENSIMEFLRYYIYEENDKGIEFFENEYKKYYEGEPPKKFKLARFYITHNKFKKAEAELKGIFDKYESLTKTMNKEQKNITFIDPPLDDLYFELGKVNFYLENYEKALENFKTANVVNPLHATALYNGAITLKKMGLTEDASKLYLDAITINPFLRETANNMLAGAQTDEK